MILGSVSNNTDSVLIRVVCFTVLNLTFWLLFYVAQQVCYFTIRHNYRWIIYISFLACSTVACFLKWYSRPSMNLLFGIPFVLLLPASLESVIGIDSVLLE